MDKHDFKMIISKFKAIRPEDDKETWSEYTWDYPETLEDEIYCWVCCDPAGRQYVSYISFLSGQIVITKHTINDETYHEMYFINNIISATDNPIYQCYKISSVIDNSAEQCILIKNYSSIIKDGCKPVQDKNVVIELKQCFNFSINDMLENLVPVGNTIRKFQLFINVELDKISHGLSVIGDSWDNGEPVTRQN